MSGSSSEGGPGPIDWDDPIPGGRVFSDFSRAQKHVGFQLVVPRLDDVPTKIVVEHPKSQPDAAARWVAIVYDLPETGRVLLLERKISFGEKELLAPLDGEHSSFRPDFFGAVDLGDATGLLRQANGIGRVQWIVDGVMMDLTGPSITPDQVRELARRV